MIDTFIRTLKNKIYKCMTSILKNVYIDKLPVDVKASAYIDSSKKPNDEDTKFKMGDIVGISKYKNIFAKSHVPNWFEEVFVIMKVKNTVPWTICYYWS